MSARPGVLVVVPVYGDLPSLLDCVESLFTTVDLSRHSVLLVNDCGPDADEIERALLGRIDGRTGFRYERNAENLGFVGTCNRAALELDDSDRDILLLNSDTVTTPGFVDELEDVLYADDSHGVACARSNNATIASLPFRLTDPRAPRTVERTAAVFEAVSPLLPRWYDSPVAMGFCFLTRRTLIRRFGLFDDAFAPGYGEENDYCLRIGAEGFRSLIANHAVVYHAGSKSFVGARRNTLRTSHQRLLEARYPFYGEAVQSFLRYDVAPADRFADVLVPREGSRPRVVLDARGAPGRVATAALEAFLLAFPASDWSREAVLDQASATVREDAAITTTANDDDIVTATILIAGSTTPRGLLTAHRRSAVLMTLRTDLPSDALPSWHDPLRRTRAHDATAALKRHSSVVVSGDWSGAAPSLAGVLDAPLVSRAASLDERFRDLRLADAALDAAGDSSGAEVERLRTEIADLRDSRTFKTGERIARLALRLPGRQK